MNPRSDSVCCKSFAGFWQGISSSTANLLSCCVILCPCIAGGFPGICLQGGCASAGVPVVEVCS